MKKGLWIILLLLCTFSVYAQEHHYTREESEELFHLIEWREYSAQTFEEAIKEQKPIYFVLSADDWCYWCHVYESKDYLYHDDLYPYINEHFIPIYVNADKRQDLTRQYLEGGWPSTTVMYPDRERVFGFSGPRDPALLRSYLEQVAHYVQQTHFAHIAKELKYSPSIGRYPSEREMIGWHDALERYIRANHDPVYGGFGFTTQPPEWREGQKFPRGYGLQFLAERGSAESLAIVEKTFTAHDSSLENPEQNYHLFDPVEGGMHRYTTKRDWTIPHFEKMLRDQARLLPAYALLYKETNNERALHVVEKSIEYVENKLYDNGRFVGSQDAHLEGEYYYKDAATRAQLEPPHIDTEAYTHTNAEMSIALLKIARVLDREEYAQLAQSNLDFLQKHMIDRKKGAYSYHAADGTIGEFPGQLFQNAWALLAFVEGYEARGDKAHLKTAQNIARFALNNLYDWHGGGFFERNSDEDAYAPNERINLDKPYEENAVMSYAMLKLYTQTNDISYALAGLRTVATLQNGFGGIDQSYYMAQSAAYIVEHNLLALDREALTAAEHKGQQDFFLRSFVEPQEKLSEEQILLGSELISTNFVVLILLAFFAGILSFLSPCTLPILPAFFATTVNAKKQEVTRNTLYFFAGLALVFSVFGMGAAYLGKVLSDVRGLLEFVAGIVIVVMGVAQIYGKGFSGLHVRLGKDTPAFVFGLCFGLGWSACIGPILASILVIAALSTTAVLGIFLLLVYAAGLGVPLLLAALFFDRIKNKKIWKVLKGRAIKFSLFGKKITTHSMYLISGVLLIVIGSLILTGTLYTLNNWALQSAWVQKVIILSEEWLKALLT